MPVMDTLLNMALGPDALTTVPSKMPENLAMSQVENVPKTFQNLDQYC